MGLTGRAQYDETRREEGSGRFLSAVEKEKNRERGRVRDGQVRGEAQAKPKIRQIVSIILKLARSERLDRFPLKMPRLRMSYKKERKTMKKKTFLKGNLNMKKSEE